MLGRTNVSGGNSKVVNGIIEQYMALNETIDANTFVEFVNHKLVDSDTQLDTYTPSNSPRALLLPNNKVFIVYGNVDIYGMICSVEETAITVNSITKLLGDANVLYDKGISLLLLSTGEIFIAYSNGNFLFGLICTINNTTITAGETELIAGLYNEERNFSTVLLPDDKIFVVYDRSSNHALYGRVCTINETTVSVGTEVAIRTEKSSANSISAVLVSNSKVLIAYNYDNNYPLYGMICSISGSNITVESNQKIADNLTGRYISAIALSNDKVFIAHSSASSKVYLYGIVCSIADTIITVESDTLLNDMDVPNKVVSLVKLQNNKVFIVYNSIGNNLYSLECNISDTVVTVENDIELSNENSPGRTFFAIALPDNKIFIVHTKSSSTNYFINGMIHRLDKFLKKSTNKIDGITKSKITPTSKGDVWILNESEVV